ncbi:hypothetical protein OAN24_06400 [Pseudodesulfovibrio sp.]|nr:hypothetical protein [Pseudodesulfovibrio sp.]
MSLLKRDEHSKGSALICDCQGTITTVVADGMSIFGSHAEGASLRTFIDKESWNKLDDFLHRVSSQKTSMGWELNTTMASSVCPLYYFGAVHEDNTIFIIISPMPENLIFLYDQMVGIVNDQSVMLRNCQQKLHSATGGTECKDTLDAFNDALNDLDASQGKTSRQKALIKQLLDLNENPVLIVSAQGKTIAANATAHALFDSSDCSLDHITTTVASASGKATISFSGTATLTEMAARTVSIIWDEQPANLLILRDQA